MKSITTYIFLFFISYSLPAFVHFELNAGKWTEPARAFVILFYLLLSFLYFINKDINKK